MKITWKKCPSVTTGGKSYFYFTFAYNQYWWVVWDRGCQKWQFKNESKTFEAFTNLEKALEYGTEFLETN